MKPKNVHTFNTIAEFHKLAGLPSPQHPLISLVDYSKVNYATENGEISWVQHFYSIALKRGLNKNFKYGQQPYDFDEGLMSFVSPGQVVNIFVDKDSDVQPTGWILFIHPDFLWNTSLAKAIKHSDFFGYAVNEALFLSEKEEETIIGILHNIRQEYESSIDKFSQNIIIAQVEVLLNYTERFYQRQFITRQISNHEILGRLEKLLDDFFRSDDLVNNGLPSVNEIATKLNVSPNYLSGLLKSLTGQSTQQHIHDKLVEKAKTVLSTTQLSVSEIAYSLGFEHPQSFSKFFKSKVNVSPLEFRNSFN